MISHSSHSEWRVVESCPTSFSVCSPYLLALLPVTFHGVLPGVEFLCPHWKQADFIFPLHNFNPVETSFFSFTNT